MNAEIDVTGALLETERLLLRPFVLADLDDFYAYAKVPDVGEWAGWAHHQSKDESLRILRMFIAEKKTLAAVDKAAAKVIGSIGIERYHSLLPSRFDALKGRELGYALAKEYWGNGLMSEAVRRVIRYAFEDLSLDFLTCSHFSRNERSRRVIEKCGFVYIGSDVYVTQIGTKEPNLYYVLENPRAAK
jgi:[ribosomal protein S5]-alanine N-acetyltransferase